MDAIITHIDDIKPDLRIVTITPAKPFKFKAGQYCTITSGDIENRPYSIACAPRDDNMIELHVRHFGAMGTHLCTNINVGDTITIDGGFGACTYKAQCKKPMLAVAGGTGLAPIKALIEKALITSRENPVYLYHGAYGDDALYFDTQLKSWADNDPRLMYRPLISHNDPDTDPVKYGFMVNALTNDFDDLKSFRAYIGGAPDMVAQIKQCILDKNIDPKRIHHD